MGCLLVERTFIVAASTSLPSLSSTPVTPAVPLLVPLQLPSHVPSLIPPLIPSPVPSSVPPPVATRRVDVCFGPVRLTLCRCLFICMCNNNNKRRHSQWAEG